MLKSGYWLYRNWILCPCVRTIKNTFICLFFSIFLKPKTLRINISAPVLLELKRGWKNKIFTSQSSIYRVPSTSGLTSKQSWPYNHKCQIVMHLPRNIHNNCRLNKTSPQAVEFRPLHDFYILGLYQIHVYNVNWN